jgi:RNA polymerase sigma-70 factor (ECF subfamily)
MEDAMTTQQDGAFDLEQYRKFLRTLARLRLHAGADGAIDPSDVVQETLLRAHRKREQFRGRPGPELLAWLKAIMANVIADLYKKRRPKDILPDLDNSTARLGSLLEANDTSPSEEAIRDEQIKQLAEAMNELSESELMAVELRFFHEPRCSREEIAQRLSLPTAKAASSLLGRAMQKLRLRMPNDL